MGIMRLTIQIKQIIQIILIQIPQITPHKIVPQNKTIQTPIIQR